MIFQESTRTRHIVGQLESGDECVDTITDFCREHDIEAASLRGIGRLEYAEVVRFDESSGDYEPIFEGEGAFDIVHLNGNISTLGSAIVARLETVLVADGPAGPQVITGQLRSGRVVELEFVLDVFDDLELERTMDRESGRLALKAIRRTEPREASEDEETSDETDGASRSIEGQAMTWGDVAHEGDDSNAPPSSSNRRSTSDDRPSSADTSPSEGDEQMEEEQNIEDIYGDMDLDEPMVEAGDVLDHPDLGRCRVIKVEEDEYIHVRTPQRGRMRKLSLHVIEVNFQGEENGRQVFEVEV